MHTFLLADTNTDYVVVKDILEVVLIPGILAAAAILVPHKWQTRQRDFEAKTNLVSDISEQVMTTVMTLFINKSALPIVDKSTYFRSKEMENAYKKWKIDTCITGSKIHAYFPVTKNLRVSLHDQW